MLSFISSSRETRTSSRRLRHATPQVESLENIVSLSGGFTKNQVAVAVNTAEIEKAGVKAKEIENQQIAVAANAKNSDVVIAISANNSSQVKN